MSAMRHTFQPWQLPSSHNCLGAPHLAPRHTTISQDPSLLLLSGEAMVGSYGVPLGKSADAMVGEGVSQDGLASNLHSQIDKKIIASASMCLCALT
jgi:hypothetical protein